MSRPAKPAATLLAILPAMLLTACMKEKDTAEYKTSELVPHFTRTISGTDVVCSAWFSLESAPSSPVTLESTAIMTCNNYLMTLSPNGTTYAGSTLYVPGSYIAISLIRKVDGTNFTDTQRVD